MKQVVKRQLKHLPEGEQERILSVVEKNPDFFMKIAHDVQEKVRGGMNQQDAMATVMKANENELRKVTASSTFQS